METQDQSPTQVLTHTCVCRRGVNSEPHYTLTPTAGVSAAEMVPELHSRSHYAGEILYKRTSR